MGIIPNKSSIWTKQACTGKNALTYICQEGESPSLCCTKRPSYTHHACNAAGFLLKTDLLYEPKNPSALKNKNKNALPVLWIHHKKASINKVFTTDWSTQSFVSQVKEYLRDLCMQFKVLPYVDNVGGHPNELYHEGVLRVPPCQHHIPYVTH